MHADPSFRARKAPHTCSALSSTPKISADALAQRCDLHRRYHTGGRLEYDQFGYNSLHLILCVPDDLLGDFAWRKPPKAEVQLPTLSQHVWAEASSLFQYKQEADLPRTLKRAFGRVSALLETVDIELERVWQDRGRYRDSLSEDPVLGELNVDSLQRLLETKLPQANVHPVDDDADLHRILLVLGIDSPSKLLSIIDQCKEDDWSLLRIAAGGIS
jgi:putative GTP pyrophosphokinase